MNVSDRAFFILVGIAVFLVGVHLFRLAEKTPEGKWISWGSGALRSHGLTYMQAYICWLLAAFFILVTLSAP